MKSNFKSVRKVAYLVLILFAMIFLVSGICSAAVSGDYEYSVENGKATITTFYGDETNIVIPDIIDGYPVTKIGDYLFYDFSEIVSVKIPESVEVIGSHAFYKCSSLSYVEMPKNLKVIGSGAFHSCTEFSSINLPESVTEVGLAAFVDSGYYDDLSNWENGVLYLGKHLLSAKDDISGDYVVKAGTQTISDYAFDDCEGLTSVTIPEGVTYVGDYAFGACKNLTSVSLPDSLKGINEEAFVGCSKLATVKLPKNLIDIGEGAFAGCTELSEIELPDSVTTIGSDAFYETAYYLNEENWENGLLYIGDFVISANQDMDTLTIREGTKYIAGGAFGGCDKLWSVYIPDSVLTIGESAFVSCHNLGSVTIPDSVLEIGDDAFDACMNLHTIKLSENLTRIGDYAFAECHTLTELHIPEKLESLGSDVFHNCHSLLAITTDENNQYFSDVGGILFSKDKSVLIKYPNAIESISYSIPNSVRIIDDSAFVSGKFEEISIPDSVVSIGDEAFFGCHIKELIIPDSVIHIGKDAFYGCTNLKSVKLSEKLTEISVGAFAHCYSLTDLTFTDSIKIIGDRAFESCNSLTSVQIKAELVGANAFSDCEKLTTVTINRGTRILEEYAFSSIYGSYIEEVYISDIDQWCSPLFIGRPSSQNYILYLNNKPVENLVIPESVTEIPDDAFHGCSSIKTLSLHKGTKKVGYNSFTCENLTDVYYAGSKAEWSLIDFAYETGLFFLEIHFADNSETFTAEDNKTGIKADYRYDDFEGYEDEPELVVIEGGLNASIVFKDVYGKYISFDISFEVNGHKIQPDYEVEISIPLPAGFNATKTSVYYVDDSGNTTEIPSRYENGYIIFTTDHFSEYALVDESTVIGDDTTEPSEPSDPDIPHEPDEPDCSCNCHKSGFSGFIWKILRIFYKIFKINPTCECGVAHY